ncbi:MAG TPA: ectonucleotide pyrophosphatase/phosphodiesterase [Thermoanaerobaculia bacterium]|nr:ectonucleotide pyrophosphatase/phosphodiesterase [Thermoanaerobaculia bacterium]
MGKRKPRAKQVVLVSVDGLLPSFYLDDRWAAPAMQQLYREGAHATAVRTVFPALSYPAHTTLVTGALPARHGVCHNREFAPVANPPWLKDASRIRVPALWDALRAAGGKSAAVLWPMTAGAAIDWYIPDIWPGEQEDLVAAVRGNDRPVGLLEELEREATGRLTPENFNNKYLMHDLQVALIARYLFERKRPALLLLHTQSAGQVLQEPDWRNPRRQRAVAASDQVVSLILEVIERTKAWDTTTLIVVGDHGNTEVHTQIRPNLWLIEAGLRGERLDKDPWRANFFALGGSAFLRVGDPAEQNVHTVRGVLDRLPRGKRETFRIVEREELSALGADPESPLALAAAPGFVIDDRVEGPDMQSNPGMSHGHHPDMSDMNTGFIARGAGIRAGASVPMLPLTCIAPLVAELLGLDFDAPDGVVYPGLLTE